MKPLRVTYASGMVNIGSDDISFGYIPGMYTGGRAGMGLQIDRHIDRAACERMCVRIAEAVVEFASKKKGAE